MKDSFGIGDCVTIKLEDAILRKLEDAISRLTESPLHQLPDYANSKPETTVGNSSSSQTIEDDCA